MRADIICDYFLFAITLSADGMPKILMDWTGKAPEQSAFGVSTKLVSRGGYFALKEIKFPEGN